MSPRGSKSENRLSPRHDPVVESLRKQPETAALGALTCAVVAFHRGFPALARAEFADVPRELRW
jgi:hypothetical protein